MVTDEINILELDKNTHVFISGKTGYGKSYCAKQLFYSYAGIKDAVFVDIKHDPRHTDIPPEVPRCESLEEVKKELKEHWLVMFIVPQHGNIDEYIEEEITPLFGFAIEKENTAVFIDEAAIVCQTQKMSPMHYRAMITGEALGVNVVNITQRPNKVDNTLLSESEYKILFRQQLEADRKKLEGAVGEEIADQLMSLPKYDFLYVQADGEYMQTRIRTEE